MGAPCTEFPQFAKRADGTLLACLGQAPGKYSWRDVPELVPEIVTIGEPCSYPETILARTVDNRAASCVNTGKSKTWKLWAHD